MQAHGHFCLIPRSNNPMIDYDAHGHPSSLADRLRSLNDSLKSLAGRLKDAIATAVSTVVGQVFRDLIRRLLGEAESRPLHGDPFPNRFEQRQRQEPHGGWDRYDREESDWNDPRDDPWRDEREESIHRSLPVQSTAVTSRWGEALRATVQTGLWWLRVQPFRHPILATTVVALTAGGAALFAGPTLAACVSVVASVASLLLTADSARTAGEVVRSAFR
jgi:hypothetical protein